MTQNPCPSTGKNRVACPGCVVDDIGPLVRWPDQCGFARSYTSRIERGKAKPSLDAMETRAGGLKVPVVKLFDV